MQEIGHGAYGVVYMANGAGGERAAVRPRDDLASGKLLTSPMSGKGRKPWGRRSPKGQGTRKDESSKEGAVGPLGCTRGQSRSRGLF